MKIDDLVKQREQLRVKKLFKQADNKRKEIEKKGYKVIDEPSGTKIYEIKKKAMKANKNFLVLFGSGEISPTGRTIHEYVFKQMGIDNIRIALITTPAGFQPNVRTVYEEIADFFRKHLVNFHPQIKIIFANNLQDANNPEIVAGLENSHYIFTGPGSPSYALKNLKNSLLLSKINELVNQGATLSLASAATIAFSNFSLPVYEIFKVGTPLYWDKGLNYFQSIFKKLTVLPHLNNNEGGEKNDTSFCFMGKERFEKLRKLLPAIEEIWGIDEQTAAIIDLGSKKCLAMGNGEIGPI